MSVSSAFSREGVTLPSSVVDSYENLVLNYKKFLSVGNDTVYENLMTHYEAFSASVCMKDFGRPADPAKDIDAFNSYLAKQDRGSSLKRSGASIVQSNTTPAKKANTGNTTGNTSVVSPPAGKSKAVSLSPPTAKYSERKGAGTTVSRYTPEGVSVEEAKTFFDNGEKYGLSGGGGEGVKIDVDEFKATNLNQQYRYMFTPTNERALALDNQLTTVARAIYEKNPSAYPDPSPVGQPVVSGEEVQCFGRICNEAHEGRINATAVMIEGGRDDSGGRRCAVDLEKIEGGYSLFPGQIVAIEGSCPSGRKITAKKIVEGAKKPFYETSNSDMLKFNHSSSYKDGRPLSIISASGPFTPSCDLDFEPLIDLMGIVSAIQPDVVILTGPFVPGNHTMVKENKVEVTAEDGSVELLSFESLFMEKIGSILENPFLDSKLKTKIVLVPSLDDAICPNVFPQAPYADRIPGGREIGSWNMRTGGLGLNFVEMAGREDEENVEQRVFCVSNPATFKINDVVIGVTSADPLAALGTHETSKKIQRMQRLSEHLLNQQSYYPLFPSGPVSTDLGQMHKFRMPVTPDILLVPSKLSYFAKDVGGSVVINSCSLSKGTTGGTFASISIKPVPRETVEGAADLKKAREVNKRTVVEVKRI